MKEYVKPSIEEVKVLKEDIMVVSIGCDIEPLGPDGPAPIYLQ